MVGPDAPLAFLGTCAAIREPLGPSEPVDIGWHTFILHTRPYAELWGDGAACRSAACRAG